MRGGIRRARVRDAETVAVMQQGCCGKGCTLLEARTGQQQSRNAVDRPPARGAETPGASGCRQAPGMACERMLAARCLRMCVGNVGVFRHLGMCLVVQIYVGKCLGTCVGMVV